MLDKVIILLILTKFVCLLADDDDAGASVRCASEIEYIQNHPISEDDYKLLYGNKTTVAVARILIGPLLMKAAIEQIGIEEMRLAVEPKYREFLTEESLLDTTRPIFDLILPNKTYTASEETFHEISILHSKLRIITFNPKFLFSSYSLFTVEEIRHAVSYLESKFSSFRQCFFKQFDAINAQANTATEKHEKFYSVFSRTSIALQNASDPKLKVSSDAIKLKGSARLFFQKLTKESLD